MPSQHPSLRASPQKRNKTLGKLSPSKPPQPLPSSNDSQEDDDLNQGAIAGPSSPSRRRRRPSTSRRRSSSITAAASLISSYSKTSSDKGGKNAVGLDGVSDDDVDDNSNERRPNLNRQGTSDVIFAGAATETFLDARNALGRGVASPYHMALVTLLGSLAQGMPLASMFKVYSYIMCRVYQEKKKSNLSSLFLSLPPAPELPSDPICQDPWVQKATSTYAAAMATVGALLGLVLLEKCSRISRRFGRKPLMLFTHFLLAVSFLLFRVTVALPTYVAAAVLYIAVMVIEASAGAPLRIAIQNYVVDTTSEAQRAGALSFIDGFGQLGAFPSTTLGGLLAAATQTFFAPFYATMAIYLFSIGYILVFVPESKKNRHHTLIDQWEHGVSEQGQQGGEAGQSSKVTDDRSPTSANEEEEEENHNNEMQRRASYVSTAPSEQSMQSQTYFRRLFHRFNFLAPLSVFLPKRRNGGDAKSGLDWRLLNLALIVVFEESFQVFMVPILLLYNTEVFHYDVVQNGYLVSLLQGTRALFLTAIFPPIVAKAREWIGRRNNGKSLEQHHEEEEENESLLAGNRPREYGNNSKSKPDQQQVSARDMAEEENNNHHHQKDHEAKREERGKLDIIIMFVSYLFSMGSFLLLCTSRAQQESDHNRIPAWIGIGVSIVGLQLGSGATSVRTALIVNAVGEEEEQSKALAANQILCTGVYALVPLVTSSIFGWGLQLGRPELVWLFKAIMAGLSAASSLVLFLSYRDPTHHSAASR